MKNKYSFIALIIIVAITVSYRFAPFNYKKDKPLVVTTWDALGYYLYLPSVFIYHDFKELKWFPPLDQKYTMSGGTLYQAGKCRTSSNLVFKYLGGVAILQSPFFFVAHFIAGKLGYPQDGFSPPYQFAVVFAAIFYFIIALFLLRKILLIWFDDLVTTITLLLVCLASNLIQYISVDGAQSHSFIFPLYVLILYLTIQWHQKPARLTAFFIGAVIGLASISRPTEAIMLFIPLLWSTQTKEVAKNKWRLVKQNKAHIYLFCLGGFLAALPQLIYWKAATGRFVYDVGSKWVFLNPHFRVLFGWEVGWFIYTPVTIFFILGMFFMKDFPFKKSVIVFCLLNLWIIIAWNDWHYGATYSCRALTQSYPVFALALASFINHARATKFKYLIYPVGLYLILVNLFQLKQYELTILHYRDMNKKYYSRIYLNPSPTPFDISVLDTNDILKHEEGFEPVCPHAGHYAFKGNHC